MTKVKTIIYKTKNFCSCRLCRGSERVTTDLDREAFKASRSVYKSIKVGGRKPTLITFNPDVFMYVHVSANGNMDLPAGEARLIDGLSPVLDMPDSVHGCWKLRENQRFQLYVRPSIWMYLAEVVIVETRGDQNIQHIPVNP